MLVNPYRNPPGAIPGTRILETTLGVIGARVRDPLETARVWEVQGLYLPLPSRMLGGIRVKLCDQKGFVAFCNQRDFEVLMEVAQPGDYCGWAGHAYVGPNDPEWFGLCCDDDDLLDDLQEREMFLRGQCPGGILLPSLDLERRVHLEVKNDVEELLVMVGDIDPDTGLFPDTRFETIERRWLRSERRRVRWERS